MNDANPYRVGGGTEDFVAREISDSAHGIHFLSFSVKTIGSLNPEHSDIFEIKIKNISRRGSRFPDKAEFAHFTLLF